VRARSDTTKTIEPGGADPNPPVPSNAQPQTGQTTPPNAQPPTGQTAPATAQSRTPPAVHSGEETPDADGHPSPARGVGTEGENTVVDLARIGWLATVVACLIAVLILVLQGYFGYAGVTLAVAISAAINLW